MTNAVYSNSSQRSVAGKQVSFVALSAFKSILQYLIKTGTLFLLSESNTLNDATV